MTSNWPEIVAFYREVRGSRHSDLQYWQAASSVGEVAEYILGHRLRDCLFACTSMHDLCIFQNEQARQQGFPCLRIGPLHTGDVQFRYVDTFKTGRQWRRTIAPQYAVARFSRFLHELRWANIEHMTELAGAG